MCLRIVDMGHTRCENMHRRARHSGMVCRKVSTVPKWHMVVPFVVLVWFFLTIVFFLIVVFVLLP